MKKRDVDGWCGRRNGRYGCELVENTIWEGGESVVEETMNE